MRRLEAVEMGVVKVKVNSGNVFTSLLPSLLLASIDNAQ